MRSQHDGMSLWYGTPDAPAPEGDIQPGTDLAMTIGVQPIDASNRLELLYCLNHGPVQTIEVRWLRNDQLQHVQYFRTSFPDLRIGDTVEYTAVCRCAGRQVPPAEEAEPFSSSFRVVAAQSHASATASVAHEAHVLTTQDTNGTVPKEPVPVVSTPPHTIAVDEEIARLLNHTAIDKLLITGRVVDRQTHRGEMGLRIEAWGRKRTLNAVLSSATTDTEGIFSLELDEHALETIFLLGQPELFFKIFRGDNLITNTEDSLVWKADDLSEITIEVGELHSNNTMATKTAHVHVDEEREPDRSRSKQRRAPQTLPISVLAKTFQVTLPPALSTYLQEHQITTLADIRTTGGLRNIPDLPQDDPAIHILQAHANLSLLPTDVQVNAQLIERGFTSPVAIASHTQADFIIATKDVLSATEAKQIFAVAQAQTHLLNNALIEQRVNEANGFLTGQQPQEMPCECKDCRSAVSPSAYLADLMKYTLKHLKATNPDPERGPLFHLFRRGGKGRNDDHIYTTSSDEANALQGNGYLLLRSVCYVFSTPQPETVPFYRSVSQEPDTDVGHFYTTSQQEIDDNHYTLESVACYVYDAWQPGTVPLYRLRRPNGNRVYTISQQEADQSTRELALEGIACYVFARQTDPLSMLHTHFHQPFGDLPLSCEAMETQVRQVRLCIEVLRLYLKTIWVQVPLPIREALANAERDYALKAYQTLLVKLGTSYEEIRLIRSAPPKAQQALTDKLGIDLHVNGVDVLHELFLAEITAQKLEDLFGLVDTGRDPLAAGQPSRMQMWQQEHLRTLWRAQDWSTDPYSQGNLPVIDPDIVTPDDFRHPVVKAALTDPDQPFDLWIKRRDWLDAQLRAFADKRWDDQKRQRSDMAAMLTILQAMEMPVVYDSQQRTAWQHPLLEHFDDLRRDLRGSDKQAAQGAAKTIQTDLHLPIGAFARLMDIRAKAVRQEAKQSDEAVTDEEWSDVYAILGAVQKRIFSQVWVQEETKWETANNRQQLLSPRHFWLSLREPRAGIWSSALPSPRIDPQIVSLNDLPEPMVDQRAFQFWQERQAEIYGIHKALQKENETRGFEAMLKQALGDPDSNNHSTLKLPYDIDALNDELDSGTVADVRVARQRIEGNLYMSVEDFTRLMLIRTKVRNNRKPTQAEWDAVYTLLTTAQKRKRSYIQWAKDEMDSATGVKYWQALKARLPRWLATPAARQAWHQALSIRSQPPIIDPDVIGLDYLQTQTGVAYTFWITRMNAIGDKIAALRDRPTTRPSLDAMLRELVGISEAQLADLAEAREGGESIAGRLAQLNLTTAAFDYLVRICKLLEGSEPALPAEWEAVYSILVQVWKQRQFADWRSEERSADIFLSHDAFKLPTPGPSVFPPLPPSDPPAWRASWGTLWNWEETLQARIKQDETVIEGLRQIVSETEEILLSMLRDILVWATDAPGSMLTEKAKWITAHLLIDAQMDSCQMTTRIAQAIETLQGLLWSARLGQLDGFMLDAPDFDEEWRWLGSYATWRAAMFVFLYPDNVLLPSLRKQELQTPAFKKLLNDLHSSQSLTSEDARQAAKAYASYLADVSSLSIEACCQPANLPQSPFYLFALARSGTVYWSSYIPQFPPDYAQSFWTAINAFSHMEVLKLVGAIPYRTAWNDQCVYLFAHVRAQGEEQIGFTRYNLDRPGNWEQFQKLETKDIGDFTAVLVQSTNHGNPPRLAILNSNGEAFLLTLNAQGTDWAQKKPTSMAQFVSSSRLCAAVETGFGYCLFMENQSGGKMLFSAHFFGFDLKSQNSMWIGSGKKWQGALSFYNDGSIPANTDPTRLYVFWFDGIQSVYKSLQFSNISPSPNTMNLQVTQSSVSSTPFLGKQDSYLAVNSSSDIWELQFKSKHIAFYRDTGGEIGVFLAELTYDPFYSLVEKKRSPAAPLIGPWRLFNITDELSLQDLQQRAIDIRDAWEYNKNGPLSNLTYLEEAHYFVPVHLALQLQARGEYITALSWFRTVYDYSAPFDKRKIYYGLLLEESTQPRYQRAANWLLDPLNPHAIASTRQNTYTRNTLLSLVRCFLDYADDEFTRDTAESVPRARILYTTALELLDAPELKQSMGQCEAIIVDIGVNALQQLPKEWQPVWHQLTRSLRGIGDAFRLTPVVEQIKTALAEKKPWPEFFEETSQAMQQAQEMAPPRLVELVVVVPLQLEAVYTRLLARSGEAEAVAQVSAIPAVDDSVSSPFVPLEGRAKGGSVPDVTYGFCVPANPMLKRLRLRAELNLYKIHTCRNIAGMERQLESYAALTDTESELPMIGARGLVVQPGSTTLRPTPYRYSVLIERAKHHVSLAQQIEASFLATMEKRDAEAYNLLKARQDIGLALAGVRLQKLRVEEATDGVSLAVQQSRRAQMQRDHFASLLELGVSDLEKEAFEQTRETVLAFAVVPIAGLGGASSALAQVDTMRANFERRAQDWEYQKNLAKQDMYIGSQQIGVAQDHVSVVDQEHTIAEIQEAHAEAMVNFLANKFTNVDLYDWMSNILEEVYRFFLQQATSMAQLASNQLAFERHEVLPPFIQSNYWMASFGSGTSSASNGNAPDRRGLTGSARLLQDIYQLDQYAFETDKRKLQLSKTISLALLAPIEFQQFRETGLMIFHTPLELFDRDFPGHYLRLVTRVRTSVIALIPPVQGIHASLSTNGVSRVVISGDSFQSIVIRRDPETAALSSPLNATGVFELNPRPDMLLPFEWIGVETTWEFRMPKAANQFDYSTIADVQLTIEYTALESLDYRQQIIRQLNRTISADRFFSFRQQFADQWYDLHNPEQVADPGIPMTVQFDTHREDFPPNIEDLKIQQLVLYFSRANGKSFEVTVDRLRFTQQGTNGSVEGGATSIDGVISTRRGNAGSWTLMLDKAPIGTWEMALLDTTEVRNWFKDEQIEDILFVITYSGRTPEWV